LRSVAPDASAELPPRLRHAAAATRHPGPSPDWRRTARSARHLEIRSGDPRPCRVRVVAGRSHLAERIRKWRTGRSHQRPQGHRTRKV